MTPTSRRTFLASATAASLAWSRLPVIGAEGRNSVVAETMQAHRTCNSKGAFKSRTAARLFAKRWGQRAYRCAVCSCWHLTSHGGRR